MTYPSDTHELCTSKKWNISEGTSIGALNHNMEDGDKINAGYTAPPRELSKVLGEVTVTAKMPARFLAAPWMLVANAELGVEEFRKGNNPRIIEYHATTCMSKSQETPWCSSFVNWTLLQTNIRGTNSARAYSWISWGQKLKKPAFGSIAVMNYSHVGFVAGMNTDGRLILLGGNQGVPGSVNLSPNSMNSVITYRYPTGLVPNYKLPNYNLRGRSLNIYSTH